MPSLLTFSILGVLVLGYVIGVRRSSRLVTAGPARVSLHSRPEHHGLLVAIWCGIPSLLIVALAVGFRDPIISALVLRELPEALKAQEHVALDRVTAVAAGFVQGGVHPAIANAAAHMNELDRLGGMATIGLALALGTGGLVVASRRIHPELRARNHVEKAMEWLLAASSTLAIITTIGIVLSVLFEALRFFQFVGVGEFLFGLHWSPQTAIREDQVGGSGSFGAVPLFAGTLLISAIALGVGAPIGLLSAIYLAEYATPRQRTFAKPMLEVLAGIPTVVYGFFAALTVAPLVRGFGESLGLEVSSESALAAGLVMGIMLVPFVSSLSDDVITAVPQSLREGSYGLGASKSETIRMVVLPAALPGIVGAVLLAVSRAVGETMIVVMAAGLSAKLTANPFEAVTTVTVQIVTLLVGDQEFDSPKTLAAFALGLALFATTLALNAYALRVVRKYREQYD